MFRTLAFDQPIQEQTRESFTAMIGFKKIYSNPLHFFLRVKDIRDENKRKIKYFAYTTNAAPKQIFWGYFDEKTKHSLFIRGVHTMQKIMQNFIMNGKILVIC